jgi:hypothetical protein
MTAYFDRIALFGKPDAPLYEVISTQERPAG